MMSKTLLLSGIVVLTLGTSNAFAGFLADAPPVTQPAQMAGRQATPTTTSDPSTTTLSRDPWQCVTENITQYFVDVPTPTGNVLSAINSYGAEVGKACRETATGLDFLSCTVSDPKSWCGFTTAAPASVLSSYSTYMSAVTTFWRAKSSTISVLSTSCPVAWDKPDLARHEWLKIAAAHAECYIQAHPETSSSSAASISGTSSQTTTSTRSTPKTQSSRGTSARGQALDGFGLMTTGLAAVLVNAAM